MNNYLNLEQRIQKKKMRLGTKLLIAGGLLAGAAYLTGRRVWNYFYPPTFKRYLAVATMAIAFLGVRNCDIINTEIRDFYNKTRKTSEIRIDKTEQMNELESRIKELTTINSESNLKYPGKN